MSIQGIFLIDIIGLGFLVLLLNLVRTKRLYVSYAVIWIGALLGFMLLISIPQLLYLVPKLVGAIYPASALSLLAFVFIVLVLIFMSVKLSQLNARQVELIQRMALKELEDLEDRQAQNKDTVEGTS